MSTYIFILGSALLVAAQLAVSVANRERVDMAARAEQIEAKLDAALHDWAHQTFQFGEPEPGGAQVAEAGETLSARSAARADSQPQTASAPPQR